MAAPEIVSSVFRPNIFAGKTAIVTGGGTGIGRGIALELLYLGCKVLVASRKLDRLEEAVREMRQTIPPGSSACLEYIQCNIREEDEVQTLISTALEKFGKLDFLVNNAGGHFSSPLENVSLKGWKAVIETNLTGTFLCCKEVYNKWMKDNGGSIVTIIVDMWKGFPGISPSGAARAGVDNLTKSLAIEWAPAGVRINTVAPGSSIYSPTAASAMHGTSGREMFEFQVPRIPAKRLGTVEEVSAAVCFLLSPAAAFITGECIKVDGGHSLYTTSFAWEVPDHEKMPAYTWKADAKTKSNL